MLRANPGERGVAGLVQHRTGLLNSCMKYDGNKFSIIIRRASFISVLVVTVKSGTAGCGETRVYCSIAFCTLYRPLLCARQNHDTGGRFWRTVVVIRTSRHFVGSSMEYNVENRVEEADLVFKLQSNISS